MRCSTPANDCATSAIVVYGTRSRTAANAAVPQPWTLLLERDGETRAIPVADFASVSNVDDPANWFSLWF